MLYKSRGCHNKFDSMKSLRVYYCYFKISQCRYMEHGLKDINFYAPWAICYNFPIVYDKPPGPPAFVRWVYYNFPIVYDKPPGPPAFVRWVYWKLFLIILVNHIQVNCVSQFIKSTLWFLYEIAKWWPACFFLIESMLILLMWKTHCTGVSIHSILVWCHQIHWE